jgi:hypothetical protein
LRTTTRRRDEHTPERERPIRSRWYLAPYLTARGRAGEHDAQAALEPPPGFEDVEIAVTEPGMLATPALRAP